MFFSIFFLSILLSLCQLVYFTTIQLSFKIRVILRIFLKSAIKEDGNTLPFSFSIEAIHFRTTLQSKGKRQFARNKVRACVPHILIAHV